MISVFSLVAVMILSTGCGSDGDSKTSFDDVTLAYTTSGAYDLSQYYLPKQGQTNNFIERSYKNEKGKKSYDDTPDNESFNAERFEVIGTTINEYDGETLDTINTILSNKIHSVDAEDNTSMDIVRFADKGDYIVKNSMTTDSGIQIKQVCKLNKHLASKVVNNVTYDDVIEIICDATGFASGTLQGQSFEVTFDSQDTAYFAKDTGNISSTSERCGTTKLGSIEKKECEKETSQITTIN